MSPAALLVALAAALPLDPLPDGAVARLGTTARRSYSTTGLAVAPDGKTVRTVSDTPGRLCEWDLATGRLLATAPVVPTPGARHAFLPGLTEYLARVGPRTLRVVEARTGKTVRELTFPDGFEVADPWGRQTPPDGTPFVARGRRTGKGWPDDAREFVAVVRPAGGDPVPLGPLPGQTNNATASRDGARVAVTSGMPGYSGELSCWDAATGKRLWAVSSGQFAAAVFTPDGKAVVVRSGSGDHWLERLDAATGKPLPGWEATPAGVNLDLLAFSPDGSLLVTNRGVVSAKTGKELYPKPAGYGRVAFTPDGRGLVTTYPTLALWDAATGKSRWPELPPGLTRPADRLLLDPAGRWVVAGNDDDCLYWNLPAGRPWPFDALRGTRGWALGPDGRTVYAVGQREVVGVDVTTGKVGPVLKAGAAATKEFPNETYQWAAVDPDGTVTVATTVGRYEEDSTETREEVEVRWDPAAGKTSTRPAARTPPWSWSRSADRRVLAGPVYGKKPLTGDPPMVGFAVWDAKAEREVVRAPADGLLAAELSADGRRLVAVYRDRMAVWDVAGGRELKPFRTVPDGGWTAVLAVSADGTRAVTAHALGSVLVWDLGR
ncbi:MAG: hypothetical protein C0501_22055 [Isosphaera sp.]|nr:hypothetical protein [Isosphaera sp.]